MVAFAVNIKLQHVAEPQVTECVVSAIKVSPAFIVTVSGLLTGPPPYRVSSQNKYNIGSRRWSREFKGLKVGQVASGRHYAIHHNIC